MTQGRSQSRIGVSGPGVRVEIFPSPVTAGGSTRSDPIEWRSTEINSTSPAWPRAEIMWLNRCLYPSTGGHGYIWATIKILTARYLIC
ncbi:unannotated protein [freshwater metagenome]|uniref:Unannotated protein n=1 Tax=freshwater metagenome TaxID=449393 RepID=A0A6J6NI98_9ZZZZ